MIKPAVSPLVAVVLSAVAHAAIAQQPVFDLPVDCDLGSTCYIEDYVDTDPGADQRDYTCGLKSRDGHRGTDIVLLSFAAMDRGVNVHAAAPGVVDAIRDGMPDRPVTPETRDDIRGTECGNAVRVDHGGGWSTLYCHMKQGSLRVAGGDTVVAGTVLGQIGLSGLTNAPHLHFGVLRDDEIVDPFRPESRTTCAAPQGSGLWREALPYEPAGLFTAAFSTAVPSFDAVQSGAARAETAAWDQPLVLYGHAFHAQPGDRLTLSAAGPQGEIFRQEVILDDPKLNLFRAYGRKAPAEGWPPGAYRGYVRLMRGDTVLASRHADIEVTR